MKIWLDDIRSAPDGWEWADSVNDAIETIVYAEIHLESTKRLLETAKLLGSSNEQIAKLENWIKRDTIEVISLDHDLGDKACDGGDGIKLMDWLLKRGTLYSLEFHTANPVGRANMERMYKRYWLNESL